MFENHTDYSDWQNPTFPIREQEQHQGKAELQNAVFQIFMYDIL